jgi:hypothetical protein
MINIITTVREKVKVIKETEPRSGSFNL